MKYKRTVNYVFNGIEQSVLLEVDCPMYDEESGWYCSWKCAQFQSSSKRVYGSDEIGALYYCLNCIGAFFQEMEEHGYVFWQEIRGDRGGFSFGLLYEDLEAKELARIKNHMP